MTAERGFDKVTRFEVIDDTGRALVRYGVAVAVDLQDDGRTMKVFLTDTGNADEVRDSIVRGLRDFVRGLRDGD